MGQITVISGPERRRRWSREARLQILAEAFAPGACVSEVCRRHEISTALIYTWRRRLRQAGAVPGLSGLPTDAFAQAVVVPEPPPVASDVTPAIVVELGRGRRVTIFASAPPALATAALQALR